MPNELLLPIVNISRRHAMGIMLVLPLLGEFPKGASAQGNALGEVDLNVGFGFDSLNGALKAPAIERSEKLQRQLNSQTTTFTDIVTDYSELDEFLEIKSSGSGTYNGFSFNGSGSYSDKKEFRDYSASAVLRSISIASTAAELRPELTANFLEDEKLLANREAAERLQRMFVKYGDLWISRVEYGGECLVLVKYESASKARQRSWAKSSQVKYGEFSGSVDFLKKVSELTNHKSLQSRAFYSGVLNGPPLGGASAFGAGKVAEGSFNVDAMINWIAAFGSSVAKDNCQIPIRVSLSPFSATKNWNVSSDVVDLSAVRQELDSLSKKRTFVLSAIDNWAEFATDPSYFSEAYLAPEKVQPSAEILKQEAARHLDELKTVLPKIEEDIKCLRTSPIAAALEGTCRRRPELEIPIKPEILNLPVPTISYRLERLKHKPSSGGGVDVERSGVLQVKGFLPTTGENWLLNQDSTGRLEIRRMSLFWNPGRPSDDVRLLYKYNARPWVDAVEGTWATGEYEHLHTIAFKLEGRLAPAYFIEYQAHCGRGVGTTLTAGNTERSSNTVGYSVGNSAHFVESIRLAVWPKIWPA